MLTPVGSPANDRGRLPYEPMWIVFGRDNDEIIFVKDAGHGNFGSGSRPPLARQAKLGRLF